MMSLSCSANAIVDYSDIPQGFWAYAQIDYLTQEGLIGGYEDNTFRPSKNITRAEYAAMIIKAIGQENIPIETMYSFEDFNNCSNNFF